MAHKGVLANPHESLAAWVDYWIKRANPQITHWKGHLVMEYPMQLFLLPKIYVALYRFFFFSSSKIQTQNLLVKKILLSLLARTIFICWDDIGFDFLTSFTTYQWKWYFPRSNNVWPTRTQSTFFIPSYTICSTNRKCFMRWETPHDMSPRETSEWYTQVSITK